RSRRSRARAESGASARSSRKGSGLPGETRAIVRLWKWRHGWTIGIDWRGLDLRFIAQRRLKRNGLRLWRHCFRAGETRGARPRQAIVIGQVVQRQSAVAERRPRAGQPAEIKRVRRLLAQEQRHRSAIFQIVVAELAVQEEDAVVLFVDWRFLVM